MREKLHRPLTGILFDRDGTLVVDVPLNTDPSRVVPMPTAAEAVAEARAAGLLVGVATNQPGLADGRLDPCGFWTVNERISELLGPFDSWHVCPHAKDAGCRCRKPRPGMVVDAAADWGVEPGAIALIGDIGADLQAAHAAGARSVLVPTHATRHDEILSASAVAPDLLQAVRRLIGSSTTPHGLVELGRGGA